MMRKINYPIKRVVCGICGTVVLWALAAHAGVSPPDPKPVLTKVALEDMGFGTDSLGFLTLIVHEGDHDLYGLRIKEQYTDANGTTITIQEDYPVWIDSPYGPSWNSNRVPVGFRRHKNQKLWQEYLAHVRAHQEWANKKKQAGQHDDIDALDIKVRKEEMPPVWISVPEPNQVRVFVSVYDKAGNESDSIEVEGALDLFDIASKAMEKTEKDSAEDYYVGSESTAQPQAGGLPADPDNAALLYYQAFLFRPEPNDMTSSRIGAVLRGAKPDKNVRKYLQDCRETIRLAEAASQIRQCDWGIVHPDQHGLSLGVIWQMRELSFVLNVYARTLAADGKYRAALDTCLKLRRLAGHIGEDTYAMYATSLALDTMALSCIQHVLGSMPPDIDTVTWLQGQLTVQGAPRSPARAMEIARDIELQFMRTNPDCLESWRKQVEESAEDENAKKDILSLTDEELLVGARQSYDKFLNLVNRIIGSDIPYVEKHAEIQRLSNDLEQQPVSNPVTLLPLNAQYPIFYYRVHIRRAGHFNAIRAAIEIYLATAKTGQLPETLPHYLPKDPYSGQDFEYETTKEGFVLRCRVKAIDDGKVWQYEFKVRKSDSAEGQPSQ